MISQLKAVVGFIEEEPVKILKESEEIDESLGSKNAEDKEALRQEDVLKIRIEDVSFSSRTMRALSEASIRTIGGLARKKEEDLRDIDGLGDRGIAEIKRALGNYGINLK